MTMERSALDWLRPSGGSKENCMAWSQAGCMESPVPVIDKPTTEAILRGFASLPNEQALEFLQTRSCGLTDAQASSRLRTQGPNILSSHKPPSWFMLLLSSIPNPFNFLLVFLAVLSVAMPDRDWAGFGVLMVMVAISCVLRFWQEHKSSIAVFKLQSSITSQCDVRRDNATDKSDSDSAVVTIDIRHIVPGDIVLLSPGTVVPADVLILKSSYLRISQSMWTGESEPAAKSPVGDGEKGDESVFDLSNLALMGSNIISGSGEGVVLRTGDDALIADLARELNKKRDTNAFQKGIQHVTWMLIGFMVIMVPIVLVISGKTTGDWANAALFSVSVAVGLVPEMLPAIVNANLARGAYDLSRKKAIVKRLDSVQNLGAMSVLCSDKTGTLTKDELSVESFVDAAGNTDYTVIQLAKIESSLQGSNGNNMDQAITDYQLPSGTPVHLAHHERVAVVPFTFERRRSACIVRGTTNAHILICKGAFEEILSLCSFVNLENKAVPIDNAMRRDLQRRVANTNALGHRVLLLASKSVDPTAAIMDEDSIGSLETDMTLRGLINFVDPPKDDAKESIAQLRSLGVDVKILTGDTLGTALSVCRALELVSADDDTEDQIQSITGADLAEISVAKEFDETVRSCKVFAKVTPDQKGKIIASLRKAGYCTGMLGDGINDCIALRSADVGISVDSGAGVAKDCADIILTEKGLSIIVDSVVLGRVTHGNTIKYIKMVASSNFGNVFSILAASAWLPFTPMISIQLLAQNLLYDISQIAIPWDNIDPEYLQTPRLWKTWDLLRFVLVLGPTSSVIDVFTFLLGWFFYGVQSTDDPEAVQLFQTHWFLQGLLTQTFIIHLLRTHKIPFIQSNAARVMSISTVTIMTIGFVIPWIPAFRPAFSFQQPDPSFVGFLAAELILYALEVQLVKVIYIKIFGTWL